jgi:hypothetical protein
VLVRPDGMVAWRQATAVNDPLVALRSALETLTGTPLATPQPDRDGAAPHLEKCA